MNASAPDKKHLVLIDGSGFIFRAFHAIPPMNDPEGTPVNAVYGFTNMMIKLVKERVATHMAVIFDAGRKTFRNDIYPAYKAHRPPPPEELIPQFSLVREASTILGLPTIELPGWEADDLIASYAKTMVEQGGTCTIISSDKDLMQLVNDHVRMQDPIKEKIIQSKDVEAKFGVKPADMISLQALMGDSVDNVPGIPGIGPKTAASLIHEYGQLEDILAAIPSMKPSKRRDNLDKHQEDARISYQLVQLKNDIELPTPIDQLTCYEANMEQVTEWLQKHGFRSILNRISKEPGGLQSHTAKKQSETSTDNSIQQDKSAIISAPYSHYETVASCSQLNKWIHEIHSTHYCAIDTETDSLNALQANLVGISLATAPGKACYIPVAHQEEGSLLKPDQLTVQDVIPLLDPVFQDASILKIFHNAKYDFMVLKQNGFTQPAPYDDTMLISYSQAAGAHRHGLDELAERHLHHQTISYDSVTGTGRKRISFAQVPLDKATEYAAEDADVTLRLWQILHPQLRPAQALNLYDSIERPLVHVLTDMEENGILIDAPLLKKLSHEFSEKMGKEETEIYQLAGDEFNLASPKQLGEILFEKMGLSGGKKMKSGSWGTDVQVLQELSDQGHEIAKKILAWRQLAKLKSTYTDALVKQINPNTHRVHTSFNMVGTVTGRLSSNDPNLQNIPVRTEEGGRIREAFIAAPGHMLVSADYSQIELRLLAHVANIPHLKESFIHGEDIHARTASEVFDVPLKDMPPLIRRQAKAINFGIIYGISAFGLAKQLGVSTSTAKHYIETYFQRYPEIREYMQNTQEEAKEKGYVLTPFGRKCWIAGIQNSKGPQRAYAERQAINAPLQGGAADIIKCAMRDMNRIIKEQSLPARILLQVHDELLFEVRESYAEEFAAIAKNVMENTVNLSIPLIVDAGIGPNWSKAH